MSTPTRPRSPQRGRPGVDRPGADGPGVDGPSVESDRPGTDRLSVEHSSTYVTQRGPRLPKPPRVKRPSLPPVPERARPFGVASAIAAGWAAVMGLIVIGVPVLLVWAAGNSQSSGGDALAMAANVWLGANHVGFTVAGGPFGLLPLGLLVVPFLLLRLSSGWATRILRPADLPDAGLLVVATSVFYGLIGGLVAVFAGRTAIHANPFEAAAWCTVVALASTTWTVLRTAHLGTAAGDRLPRRVRPMIVPAAAGVGAVLAGATLVTLGSLFIHGGDALALFRASDGGVVGTLALVVLCVAYLPNLIVWAAAFCIGPGFAVGAGTSVTLAGVASGPLPAFPLFAAIPSSGIPAAPAWLVLLVPIAGGIASAVWTTRDDPSLDPESTALRAGLSGVGAGLTLGVLAWLAGGPLGGGRLDVVGPSPWQVGALAAIELGLIAAVAGWVIGWRATRTRA